MWILGGGWNYESAIQRAPAADPLNWSQPEFFADYDYPGWIAAGRPAALDPSHDYRVAAAVTVSSGDEEGLWFDAEWRSDPGYPVLEDGFPLSLLHTPESPPALVDLDGDGDLEIIYSDTINRIHARHHDGTSVAGWPVYPGRDLADGPVAVGVLNVTGELLVVAGTVDGWVVAYTAAGEVAPGWPADIGTDAETYVSIGALGGQSPRTVVVCSGNVLTFRDGHGEFPDGAYQRTSGGRVYHAPAAIGDVDGDGRAEIVCTPGNQVYAVKMDVLPSVLSRFFTADVSDAATLGDLDRDGDVEVIVPTADGTLYALNGDGSDVPTAWPFVSATGSELTSAAIAQCVGNQDPEVVVAAHDWTVHQLLPDGEQHYNYPVHTSGLWYIYGAPIIGEIEGSPDILVGARDDRIWSWSNLGYLNPGWPRDLDQKINLSPAMGDIDQDGHVEVVVLSENRLAIFDVNHPEATPDRTWPMYGHDARRTGCADCPEDVTTPVPDGPATFTRVRFAPPTPNPAADSAVFTFAVPIRAGVSLEIYDVRGRLVRRVLRSECDAGEHIVGWDGRDGGGRHVAAGQYLARLKVRGQGLQETLHRKILILR
jgi:hypothetical protein